MTDHTDHERDRRDERASAALDARVAAPAASTTGAQADEETEARVVAMLAAREALRDDTDALPAPALDAMVRSAVQAASSPVGDEAPVALPRRARRSAGPRWLAAAAAAVVVVAGLGVWVTRHGTGSTESAEVAESTTEVAEQADAGAQDRAGPAASGAESDPSVAGEAPADPVPAGPGPTELTTSTLAASAPTPAAGGDGVAADVPSALTETGAATRALGLSVRNGAAAIAGQVG